MGAAYMMITSSCGLACKQGRKGPGTAGLCRIPAVPLSSRRTVYAPVRDDLSAAPGTATAVAKAPVAANLALINGQWSRDRRQLLPRWAPRDRRGSHWPPATGGLVAQPFCPARNRCLPRVPQSGPTPQREGLTAGDGRLPSGGARPAADGTGLQLRRWAPEGWTLPRHGIRLGNRATSPRRPSHYRHRRDVCAESRFSAP
jgi:hypothetical protein